MPTLPDPPGQLPEYATFAKHLGETFRAQVDGRPAIELVLAQAISGRMAGPRPGLPDRPFSLVFVSRGPAAPVQRTYRLEHPRLGALDLFLVPLGPEGGGMRFEAVFN